jgi:hypothetical protein
LKLPAYFATRFLMFFFPVWHYQAKAFLQTIAGCIKKMLILLQVGKTIKKGRC